MGTRFGSADTSVAAEKAQLDALRALGPGDRAAMVLELSANLRRILEDGVRFRHPDYDEAQVTAAAARIAIGRAAYHVADRE